MDRPLHEYLLDIVGHEFICYHPTNSGARLWCAKTEEGDYTVVDDNGATYYFDDGSDVCSESPILCIDDNRLLCRCDDKYGVISLEGSTIIPFVYDEFREREKGKYNVLIDNRWGVISLLGEEIFRIKYSEPIPKWKLVYEDTGECYCQAKSTSGEEMGFGRLILVEDAVTHRKGLVDLLGNEIIPVIYLNIIRCFTENDVLNHGYVYVSMEGSFSANSNFFSDHYGGIWGCYDDNGKEIVPIKYNCIKHESCHFHAGYGGSFTRSHYNYFESSSRSEEIYTGKYDLYDNQGSFIIGGFDDCIIKENYFIFYYGGLWEDWSDDYGNVDVWFENGALFSIIVDKKLRSFLKRIPKNNTIDELEYEYNFLMNNYPHGEGLLVGESPFIRKGQRYTANEKENPFPFGISVNRSFSVDDNIVFYSFNGFSFGIIFIKEDKVIPPSYCSDVEIIMDGLIFISKENKHTGEPKVGIRNFRKELLEPKFDLITLPYEGIALAFYIINGLYELSNDNDEGMYKCILLHIDKDAIEQEVLLKLSSDELFHLLYDKSPNWGSFSISTENQIALSNYWQNVPRNEYFRFWYQDSDLDYLQEEECESYDDDIEIPNWNDYYNYDYYNDGLDMDQQDPRFWGF